MLLKTCDLENVNSYQLWLLSSARRLEREKIPFSSSQIILKLMSGHFNLEKIENFFEKKNHIIAT